MKNFFELRANNVRRVLSRPGWTIEDIRQAVRDAEAGIAYHALTVRPVQAPFYRVRSDGRAFAVERTRDRHVVLGPVDIDEAREFVREANAAVSATADRSREAA